MRVCVVAGAGGEDLVVSVFRYSEEISVGLEGCNIWTEMGGTTLGSGLHKH